MPYEIEKISSALDLMIGCAKKSPGGSSGELACGKVLLALYNERPCDMQQLWYLSGDTARAAAVVLDTWLNMSDRHSLFAGRTDEMEALKSRTGAS
jgi:hypothetical protein